MLVDRTCVLRLFESHFRIVFSDRTFDCTSRETNPSGLQMRASPIKRLGVFKCVIYAPRKIFAKAYSLAQLETLQPRN